MTIKPSDARMHAYQFTFVRLSVVLVMTYIMLVPLAFSIKTILIMLLAVVVQAIFLAIEAFEFALKQRASKDWMDTLADRNAMDRIASGDRHLDWQAITRDAVDDIKRHMETERFEDELGRSWVREVLVWVLGLVLTFLLGPLVAWGLSEAMWRWTPDLVQLLVFGTSKTL